MHVKCISLCSGIYLPQWYIVKIWPAGSLAGMKNAERCEHRILRVASVLGPRNNYSEPHDSDWSNCTG